MKLTIGMAAFQNEIEVWFTLQALRLYQDVKNVELLVVDNGGTDNMARTVIDCRARYERFTDVVGTAVPRNKVFEWAAGDFVLCIDSHVMLAPRAITQLKWWLESHWEDARNLIHGPWLKSGMDGVTTHYLPVWRGQQWGIWGPIEAHEAIPTEPFEIDMMALGLMGCRKDSWLGFHPECKSFGGVEGLLDAKYRHAGRKSLCLPFLKWMHCFIETPDRVKYPSSMADKTRNYELGFDELGMLEEKENARKHLTTGEVIESAWPESA